MTLRKLDIGPYGSFICPECDGKLRFVEGGAVAIEGGHLDMENYKPRYICDRCGVFYREVLTTGYYDVFQLDERERLRPAEESTPAKAGGGAASPVALPRRPGEAVPCPVCGTPFRFVEGGAVRVVDGKVDMENTKPKYECDKCGVFYREVLSSGFYLSYPQTDEDRI